jgi:hypothetical protein
MQVAIVEWRSSVVGASGAEMFGGLVEALSCPSILWPLGGLTSGMAVRVKERPAKRVGWLLRQRRLEARW